MNYYIDVDGQRKMFHSHMLRKCLGRTFNFVKEVTAAVVEEDEKLGSQISDPNNNRSEV